VRKKITGPLEGTVAAMVNRNWVRFVISSLNMRAAFFCGALALAGSTIVAPVKSSDPAKTDVVRRRKMIDLVTKRLYARTA
jgi:hypothetical protein